jgi:hypothetical protein
VRFAGNSFLRFLSFLRKKKEPSFEEKIEEVKENYSNGHTSTGAHVNHAGIPLLAYQTIN